MRYFLLVTIIFSMNANAMMPVFDASAFVQLVQEVQQMERQYQTLQQTYQNATQQLQQQKQLVQDAEGHYGYGDLLNSSQDLQNREWSPDNWDDALQGLAGGNPERYQQLVDEYKKNNPTLSEKDYEKGGSSANGSIYQQQIAVNQAATVNATYSFNDIKQHLDDVHQLSQQIEQTKDTKAAVDLNSRIQTEMAYISIQELKMQTLLNQQMAASDTQAIAEKTSAVQFNTMPEEK